MHDAILQSDTETRIVNTQCIKNLKVTIRKYFVLIWREILAMRIIKKDGVVYLCGGSYRTAVRHWSVNELKHFLLIIKVGKEGLLF